MFSQNRCPAARRAAYRVRPKPKIKSLETTHSGPFVGAEREGRKRSSGSNSAGMAGSSRWCRPRDDAPSARRPCSLSSSPLPPPDRGRRAGHHPRRPLEPRAAAPPRTNSGNQQMKPQQVKQKSHLAHQSQVAKTHSSETFELPPVVVCRVQFERLAPFLLFS